MGPAATPSASAPVGTTVVAASVRSVVLGKPEHVEPAAWLLLSNRYAAVVMGRSGVMINPNRNVAGPAKRATAPHLNRWEKDAGDAVLFPVATSLSQSVGQGIRLG